MDPASLLAFIGFGLHVSRRIYQLYDKAKDAAEDVTELCKSANSLRSIFQLLEGTIRNTSNAEALVTTVHDNIKACEAGLKRLDKKIAKIQRLSSEPTVLNLRLRLRYAFQEKTIAKLNGIVNKDLLGNLRLTLLALNLHVSVEIQAAFENAQTRTRDAYQTLQADFEDGLRTVNEGVGNLADMLDSLRLGDQRDKIIKWVASDDIVGSFHQSICDQRQSGTGDWFLHCETYQKWRASAGSFIWLHGIPGCGKTVLCSSVIAETIAYCSLRANHHLGFFYFSFSNTERQSTDVFIRSVLRQLLLQRETLPNRVVDIWRRFGHTQPNLDTWKEMLCAVVEGNRETYLLVDALDECPSLSGERGKLLKYVRVLIGMKMPNLHILVTSRKESDIEDVLGHIGDFGPFSIRNAQVDHDILSYLKEEMSRDRIMQQWPSALRREVETELGSKANGMFRWASCQLAELRKCLRPSVVRKTLAILPMTLDETYNRMLQAIAPQHREEAINAIWWLMCSEQPLSVRELAEAVIIDLDHDANIDTSERLFDSTYITAILSGLVVVVEDHVRLAHFSVAEYLASDRLAKSEMAEFWVSVPDCRAKLLRACLRYLQTDDIQIECSGNQQYGDHFKIINEAPLLRHAANCWVDYQLSCTGDQAVSTVPIVVSFLQCESATRLWKMCCWSRLLDGWRYRTTYRSIHSYAYADALYLAARFGLDSVVEALTAEDIGNTQAERSRSFTDAFRIACYHSHASTVRRLLEARVRLRANVEDLKMVLEVALDAVRFGRPSPEVILLLLDNFTLTSSGRADSHWTFLTAQLLKWAIRTAQQEIVEKILGQLGDAIDDELFLSEYRQSPGYYQYTSYGHGGSPGYHAAMAGNIGILRLFLVGWKDVDEQDPEGRTALYWAAFQGHEDILRLLLDRGASPNAVVSGYGWSPLYWARERKHESIQILLEQAMEWAA